MLYLKSNFEECCAGFIDQINDTHDKQKQNHLNYEKQCELKLLEEF